MALLHGGAGRFTAKIGGFRPGRAVAKGYTQPIMLGLK
jgi:hypothetical protein